MERKSKNEKVLKEILILLVGADDKPIPSEEHLKVELFVLAKVDPKLSKYILKYFKNGKKED